MKEGTTGDPSAYVETLENSVKTRLEEKIAGETAARLDSQPTKATGQRLGPSNHRAAV